MATTPAGPDIVETPPPAMTTSQSPQSQRTVPILQAGGGGLFPAIASRKIDAFSPHILSCLSKIYSSLSRDSGSHTLSKAATMNFLEEIQNTHSTPAVGLSSDPNGFNDFLAYMASAESSALAPPSEETRDLTKPISNYFISSSHNTYLTGNQLYSDASTEAYKNVLSRSCRCLEIDVWDGDSRESPDEDDEKDRTGIKSSLRNRLGQKFSDAKAGVINRHDAPPPRPGVPDDLSLPKPSVEEKRREPRVLHGHTLTREVSFRSVCAAIRDSAFLATNLPIIVSLEVHADLEQQEIMVEIMKETWAGMLVDITAQAERDIRHLPSPDQLRGKILIKVKWTPDSKSGESNNPVDHVVSDSFDESVTDGKKEKKKKASKTLKALSELGIYTRAYTFKHFDQPEALIPTHVFSLSKQKVTEMHESHSDSLFAHNRNYLMRVFPEGLRVDSSNVDPTFLWRQGAQMVALNWQSCDRGMMLNEGMFAGEEGWVLKPDGYLGTLGGGEAAMQSQIKRLTLDLTVELIAAQNLPLPPGDKEASRFHPYVKCQLHVDSRTERSTAEDQKDDGLKWRSKTAKGVDPAFQETLHFPAVTGVIEKLSFLRLKIHDARRLGKDALAAWACVRLDRLREGFRFIHLLDARGMPSSAVLLVRVTKRLS